MHFFRILDFFSKKKFGPKKFFSKSANFSRKIEKMTKKTILRGPRPLKSHFFEKKFFEKKTFLDQKWPKWTQNDQKWSIFREKSILCRKNDFERPKPAKNTFCGYSGNKITYALTEKVDFINPKVKSGFLGRGAQWKGPKNPDLTECY